MGALVRVVGRSDQKSQHSCPLHTQLRVTLPEYHIEEVLIFVCNIKKG